MPDFLEIYHIEDGVTKKINIDWKRITAFYATDDGGRLELNNGRVLTISKRVYERFIEFTRSTTQTHVFDQYI